MDEIRNGYTVLMKMWADSDELTPVRWFRAAKGAKYFPGLHSFGSHHWLDQFEKWNWQAGLSSLGEKPGDVSWCQSNGLAPYLGQQFCGRQGAFLTGAIHGVDAPMPVKADGSTACCQVGVRCHGGDSGSGGAGVVAFLGETIGGNQGSAPLLGVTTILTDARTGLKFGPSPLSGQLPIFGPGQAVLFNVSASYLQSGIVDTSGGQVIVSMTALGAGGWGLVDRMPSPRSYGNARVNYGDGAAYVITVGDHPSIVPTTEVGTFTLFSSVSQGAMIAEVRSYGSRGYTSRFRVTRPGPVAFDGIDGVLADGSMVVGGLVVHIGSVSGYITGGSGGTTGLTFTTIGTIITLGGTLGTHNGGSGADLSGSGGTTGGAKSVVFQATIGGAFTSGLLGAGDIPGLPASKIVSGLLGLDRGGTDANLSGTGGADTVLAQPVLGGGVVPTSLAVMLDALGGITGAF